MVPLPLPLAAYEHDFEDPESLGRFRALLAQARVRTLPLAPRIDVDDVQARGSARNRQYAQLGMFVSSHCQLLLALWDGRPSDATGGTAQVVDYHLRNTMPGFRTEDIAPNLLADDEVDGVLADTMGMISQNPMGALSVHGGLSASRVAALLSM